MSSTSSPESETTARSGFGFLFARLGWAFFGPAALLVITVLNVKGASGWFTVLDLFFVIVGGFMIWARLSERRHKRSQGLDGKPMTSSDHRRYVRGVIIAVIVAWAASNSIGGMIALS